ncbi:60S ribosomal protein L9 [Entophlyctis sp. JEL0112]|nr:60S ribosomal protein L9 [Entophlyctis sp. JEL0112]
MAPSITFTQRQRIGSIASIGSDDSDDSSAASSAASSADSVDSAADSGPTPGSTPRAARTSTRSTSDPPVVVADDDANSNLRQRRSYSMFEKPPKPILRTPSSIFRSGSRSDLSGDEANAIPLKRISFSSESLLLFNNEEAPQAVAREPLFAKDINASPPSPVLPSDSDSENLVAIAESSNAPLSWSILSTTSHSLLQPITLTPSSPVIFESVKIASSAYPQSNSPVSLRLHILVQNLHYEKAISVVYTSNSWKSNSLSGLARYDSSLGNGVDSANLKEHRFLLDLECDTSFGSNIVGSIDRIVSFEFAIKCVMGGVEFWDNRGGMNHLVMLKSEGILDALDFILMASDLCYNAGTVSTPPYVKPPRKILSALDLESSQHLKRRASMLALKMGHAIADEARRIDDEFKHGLKKQNDSATSTPRTSFSESDSSVSQTGFEISTNAMTMSRSQPRPEPSKPAETTATTSSPSDSLRVRQVGSLTHLKSLKAAGGLLTANDRVTELSERETEYVNIISRPNSPLVDVRPLRKVGSNSSLSITEVSVGSIVRSGSPLVGAVGTAVASPAPVEAAGSASTSATLVSPVPVSLKGQHSRVAVLNTPSKLGVRLDSGDDYGPLSNPLYASGEHYGSLYSSSMKSIVSEKDIIVPENVEVDIKARVAIVKGPRGTIKKSFKHIDFECRKVGPKKFNIRVWQAGRKHSACIRTVCSHIENMITGVTKGYEYKMRFVYAHFPINVNIADNAKSIEIRNFVGQKVVMKVDMLDGVTVSHSPNQKDEITIVGNDIDNVSQSAAQIQQSTRVKNKDIRKFLDGIYVSEKGNIVKDL